MISGKKAIKNFPYEKIENIIRYVKLMKLNDIEAVDMLLSNCNRKIKVEELYLDENISRNLHS